MRILKRGPKAEVGSIDLLEEATHLLRRAPLSAWVAYYVCALPFALGLLYFIADMSRGSRAWEHLSEAALGICLLFVVMKVGQAVFCDLLLHYLNDDPVDSFWGRLPRIFFVQLSFQPFGLFLLPVAAILTLPFGWCFALFQNFTVFGQGRGPLRQEISLAWRQAQTWPGQNHLTIGLVMLFWIIALPAVAVTLYSIPHLLHQLFGVESIFVQNSQYMINTTFWTVVFLMTFLVLDPLIKAAYVLRCFYGVSLSNGADLRVDLRRIQSGLVRLAILCAVTGSLLFSVVSQSWAGSEPIDPVDVRKAIVSEMNSPVYEWRLPRGEVPEDHDPGLLASLGDAIFDGLRWFGEQVQKAFGTLEDWLQKLLPDIEPESSRSPSFFRDTDPLLLALYLLCGLGLCLAGVWLYRVWRRHQRREKPVLEEVLSIPDLEAEEVSADELPADRWCSLANDLLAKGEVRLALRAMVLGALARLADDGFLKLSRYKSNRDYLLEIIQRGQSLADVREALQENVMAMEGVWYGDHSVDQVGLQRFLAQHERIMRHGHSL